MDDTQFEAGDDALVEPGYAHEAKYAAEYERQRHPHSPRRRLSGDMKDVHEFSKIIQQRQKRGSRWHGGTLTMAAIIVAGVALLAFLASMLGAEVGNDEPDAAMAAPVSVVR